MTSRFEVIMIVQAMLLTSTVANARVALEVFEKISGSYRLAQPQACDHPAILLSAQQNQPVQLRIETKPSGSGGRYWLYQISSMFKKNLSAHLNYNVSVGSGLDIVVPIDTAQTGNIPELLREMYIPSSPATFHSKMSKIYLEEAPEKIESLENRLLVRGKSVYRSHPKAPDHLRKVVSLELSSDGRLVLTQDIVEGNEASQTHAHYSCILVRALAQ
ncbi:MAG: hypothetical protein K2X47_02995 [Bdellovibrionales bacterium]|nr:hypothetical protein [Bdellovibrionales bacterium]